jgi:hypothetical protein
MEWVQGRRGLCQQQVPVPAQLAVTPFSMVTRGGNPSLGGPQPTHTLTTDHTHVAQAPPTATDHARPASRAGSGLFQRPQPAGAQAPRRLPQRAGTARGGGAWAVCRCGSPGATAPAAARQLTAVCVMCCAAAGAPGGACQAPRAHQVQHSPEGGRGHEGAPQTRGATNPWPAQRAPGATPAAATGRPTGPDQPSLSLAPTTCLPAC